MHVGIKGYVADRGTFLRLRCAVRSGFDAAGQGHGGHVAGGLDGIVAGQQFLLVAKPLVPGGFR